jgi:NADH-quinone oxidoreductase subunit G
MRTDWRRGKVMRRLAGDDPAVNEEWNCDKGRWGFQYATAFDRITKPMVRDAKTGELRAAPWSEALAVAAEGLRKARDGAHGTGLLTGGRLTVEDAYAYAKFARVVLRTNDIDFRARPIAGGSASASPASVAEEAEFLASTVAGHTEVTYADIEAAPAAVLVGLEPEEECPILFLRLRKAYSKRRLRVVALAPFASRGLEKLGAAVLATVPGDEARHLGEDPGLVEALSAPGALLFVGERLATVPGGLSAAVALAERTGARLAWVPRRAGDRGAVDAGCLPNLLPGARPVGDAAARAELSAAWGLEAGIIPSTPGRDVDGILTAAAGGRLGALIVAGVDPADLADPQLAERALDAVPFLISLEVRRSAVSRRADVVFPVAPVVEKAGSFMDWEGRLRTFDRVLSTSAMSDGRVLDALAGQLGVSLGTGDVNAVRRELGGLPITRAEPRPAPVTAPGRAAVAGPREAVLATWHQLIDLGSLTDGDEHLAGTARPAVVRIGKGTAESLGVSEGDPVTVGTERGAVTLPAAVTEMPDGIVWLPTNSPGSTVRRSLGVTAGAVVSVSAGARSERSEPRSPQSGSVGPRSPDGPLLAGGAV